MTELVNSLLSNNIMVIIGILLASLLVYSILKRLLKIIIFFLIMLTVYTVFMVYSGQEVPGSARKYIEDSGEKIDSLQKGGEILYKMMESIKQSEEQKNQSHSSLSE